MEFTDSTTGMEATREGWRILNETIDIGENAMNAASGKELGRVAAIDAIEKYTAESDARHCVMALTALINSARLLEAQFILRTGKPV